MLLLLLLCASALRVHSQDLPGQQPDAQVRPLLHALHATHAAFVTEPNCRCEPCR